ncbi:MAG: hypothetical protein ACKVGW_12535 [Verrucomicrobiia bacterium]
MKAFLLLILSIHGIAAANENAEPLTTPPDPAPIMEKAKIIADLANRIDADVAPVFLAGLRCQQQRPDLALRFINDAHLNHTMAYLTACTLYSAIFERALWD